MFSRFSLVFLSGRLTFTPVFDAEIIISMGPPGNNKFFKDILKGRRLYLIREKMWLSRQTKGIALVA